MTDDRLKKCLYNSALCIPEKIHNISDRKRSGPTAFSCRLIFAAALLAVALFLQVAPACAQASDNSASDSPGERIPARVAPPRVLAAQRFLAQRGWNPATAASINCLGTKVASLTSTVSVQAASGFAIANPTRQSLGPAAVQTPDYGLVTGRVAAVALDPADATGNRLYLGTTGGGVWVAQNASTSNTSAITFTPLTDSLSALSGAVDASISIGALTVQPGS